MGPRPRDTTLGRQERVPPHLRLRPHKQQNPVRPALPRQVQPRREKLHGHTQKFLRLVRRTILASTKEGDLVFDPFYAAKELGRFFVDAEREECAGIGAAVRSGVLREFPDLGSRDDSFGSTSGRARPHSLL